MENNVDIVAGKEDAICFGVQAPIKENNLLNNIAKINNLNPLTIIITTSHISYRNRQLGRFSDQISLFLEGKFERSLQLPHQVIT